MTRLPKVPVVNFCPDRKKERTGSLRRLPAAVTAENAPVRDFCETKKGKAGVLAVVSKDTTAKSNKAGFRMDREKDGIRNFELATRSGNGRKRANSGLSRDAGRQFETFGSRVSKITIVLFSLQKKGADLYFPLACVIFRKIRSRKSVHKGS